MTTITISDLATSPQINSRRVARDLIEWLAARGWVIVRGQIELPLAVPSEPVVYGPATGCDSPINATPTSYLGCPLQVSVAAAI